MRLTKRLRGMFSVFNKRKSEIRMQKLKFTVYLDTSSEVRQAEVEDEDAVKRFHEIMSKWHEIGFARFDKEYIPVSRITRVIVNGVE